MTYEIKVLKPNVAPCFECNSKDIAFSHYGHPRFNYGGGECRQCGHKTFSAMGINPTDEDAVKIWNAQNSISELIDAQRRTIQASKKRILELQHLQHQRQ